MKIGTFKVIFSEDVTPGEWWLISPLDRKPQETDEEYIRRLAEHGAWRIKEKPDGDQERPPEDLDDARQADLAAAEPGEA